MMKVCVQPRSGGRRAYSVRPEKRRGRFSLSPREERAGRELERGETDEKRPPLPGPLLLFWGGEGEGKRCCAPNQLLAEQYWSVTAAATKSGRCTPACVGWAGRKSLLLRVV